MQTAKKHACCVNDKLYERSDALRSETRLPSDVSGLKRCADAIVGTVEREETLHHVQGCQRPRTPKISYKQRLIEGEQNTSTINI